MGRLVVVHKNPRYQKSNSWVIVRKSTGKAVLETFDKKVADAVNTKAFDVIPAGEYLAKLNKTTKKNPRTPRVVNSNPMQVSSKRVLALRYQHLDDGQWYEHKFKPGVSMQLLGDGTVRLYRPDGKPLWKDF